MSSLYAGIPTGEWAYLEVPEVVKAIELGAKRAHDSVGSLRMETLDDFVQDAHLYAATHPGAIASINTGVMLTEHIRSRLVRDGKDSWNRDAKTESYEAMLEDREDDL